MNEIVYQCQKNEQKSDGIYCTIIFDHDVTIFQRTKKMSNVTIIGAGMMGTAMCWPLADNQHSINLVGTPLDEEIIHSIHSTRVHPKLEREIPKSVKAFSHSELPNALKNCNYIICGVSSFGVAWFAETVGPFLKPNVPVINVTKGLEDQENGDLLILPKVMDQRLPEHLQGRISFNAIGGPCIAHELAARCQTGVVFCGDQIQILDQFSHLLSTNYYHIQTSTDVVGVEVCAALKNAYAMGVGMIIGLMEKNGPDRLAHMYNPQALFFSQSIREMIRMIEIMGGKPETATWLPGVGDLYVTIFGGRTVRLGRLLGQGTTFKDASEIMKGVTLESVEVIKRISRALPKLAKRSIITQNEFPLIRFLNLMISDQTDMNGIPWESFFKHQ
jgi:glycerol-3-phosphate dehydrogenase (NAD(P)+)